jgi:L-malate glycosyltransferase
MKSTNKKSINVMHVIETLDPGGAESVLAEIIRHMPEFVNSMICCVKHSGAMSQRMKGHVGQVYELNIKEGNNISVPIKLTKLLMKNHIDVIHAHNWNTFCESTIAAILSGKPIVHTIHGHHFEYPNTIKGRFKKNIRHCFEKVLSYRSNKICTVSQAICDYILNEIGIEKERLEVLINGVDIDHKFYSVSPIMRDLGIKNENYLICFIGRLMPVKNIESLLKAMEIVVRECQDSKLVIIGDGPERKELEKSVLEKGLQSSVLFTGFRDDARDFLVEADVFVLPSYYEGISIALLEAMSAGLPSIVTAVGGNSEVVINDETGFLYPSGDVKVLSSYIIELYHDISLRKNMGEKAKERASRFFCIEGTAERYAQIYLDIIG